MARIILMLTRDPRGPATGRIMVLRTIIGACRSNGHVLQTVVIDDKPKDRAEDSAFIFTGRAGFGSIVLNVLADGLRGRRSLNECLYFAPRIEQALKSIVAEFEPDVIVADMIRTAQYAATLGKPWILDLDDLLSRRYAQWSTGGERKNIFGYYTRHVPSYVAHAVDRLFRSVLRFESRLLRKREDELARAADACCMVSRSEATTLSAELGRTVYWAPMSVSPGPRRDALPADGGMVFTGSLRYSPNYESVRYFATEIGPFLKANGLTHRLDVIGLYDEEHRRALPEAYVRLLGYVEDLGSALRTYPVFLAPIVSGTGIKTKVVEALMAGLVVASTPEGAAGLDIESPRHFLQWSEPSELARHLRMIASDPALAQRIAAEGRHYAEANFSPEIVHERWRMLVDSALGADGSIATIRQRNAGAR